MEKQVDIDIVAKHGEAGDRAWEEVDRIANGAPGNNQVIAKCLLELGHKLDQVKCELDELRKKCPK